MKTKWHWWTLVDSDYHGDKYQCKTCKYKVWADYDGGPLPDACPDCGETNLTIVKEH